MIGPADLSISLGVPGEFDHPKMIETIELVKESCLTRRRARNPFARAAAGQVLEGTGHEVFGAAARRLIHDGRRDGGRIGAQSVTNCARSRSLRTLSTGTRGYAYYVNPRWKHAGGEETLGPDFCSPSLDSKRGESWRRRIIGNCRLPGNVSDIVRSRPSCRCRAWITRARPAFRERRRAPGRGRRRSSPGCLYSSDARCRSPVSGRRQAAEVSARFCPPNWRRRPAVRNKLFRWCRRW